MLQNGWYGIVLSSCHKFKHCHHFVLLSFKCTQQLKPCTGTGNPLELKHIPSLALLEKKMGKHCKRMFCISNCVNLSSTALSLYDKYMNSTLELYTKERPKCYPYVKKFHGVRFSCRGCILEELFVVNLVYNFLYKTLIEFFLYRNRTVEEACILHFMASSGTQPSWSRIHPWGCQLYIYSRLDASSNN